MWLRCRRIELCWYCFCLHELVTKQLPLLQKQYNCIFSFLFFASCGVQKDQKDGEQNLIPPPHINCPEGGDCTFEVIKNASLNLKTDGIGKLYPEITEGDKVVIKYHYEKDEIKDVMDAGLSEYVYLEFDPNPDSNSYSIPIQMPIQIQIPTQIHIQIPSQIQIQFPDQSRMTRHR